MQLTIVISYYKALDNLILILKALNAQSNLDFEVIVSEDDNNPQTKDFVIKHAPNYLFPLIHLYQSKDDGFRKNEMLNRCIGSSKTQRLVFIDGDCIPHGQFASQYIKNIKEGYFFSGRALMLGSHISKSIVLSQDLNLLRPLSLIFSGSRPIKDAIYSPFIPLSIVARGIVGRNWGIMKSELIKINGFDQDYLKAGIGEDTDVEWRLIANGLKCANMKNKAIVYHISHKRNYTDNDVNHNIELLKMKQSLGYVICKNGIIKL